MRARGIPGPSPGRGRGYIPPSAPPTSVYVPPTTSATHMPFRRPPGSLGGPSGPSGPSRGPPRMFFAPGKFPCKPSEPEGGPNTANCSEIFSKEEDLIKLIRNMQCGYRELENICFETKICTKGLWSDQSQVSSNYQSTLNTLQTTFDKLFGDVCTPETMEPLRKRIVDYLKFNILQGLLECNLSSGQVESVLVEIKTDVSTLLDMYGNDILQHILLKIQEDKFDISKWNSENYNRFVDAVHLLVKHGLKLEKTTDKGQTTLDLLKSTKNIPPEIVDRLRQKPQKRVLLSPETLDQLHQLQSRCVVSNFSCDLENLYEKAKTQANKLWKDKRSTDENFENLHRKVEELFRNLYRSSDDARLPVIVNLKKAAHDRLNYMIVSGILMANLPDGADILNYLGRDLGPIAQTTDDDGNNVLGYFAKNMTSNKFSDPSARRNLFGLIKVLVSRGGVSLYAANANGERPFDFLAGIGEVGNMSERDLERLASDNQAALMQMEKEPQTDITTTPSPFSQLSAELREIYKLSSFNDVEAPLSLVRALMEICKAEYPEDYTFHTATGAFKVSTENNIDSRNGQLYNLDVLIRQLESLNAKVIRRMMTARTENTQDAYVAVLNDLFYERGEAYQMLTDIITRLYNNMSLFYIEKGGVPCQESLRKTQIAVSDTAKKLKETQAWAARTKNYNVETLREEFQNLLHHLYRYYHEIVCNYILPIFLDKLTPSSRSQRR